MRKRGPAREIIQSGRTVECTFIILVASLRRLTPTYDAIGVPIRVFSRRTNCHKEAGKQRLWGCIEINPGCLRRITHHNIDPPQPETELPARRTLSLLWNREPICSELKASRNQRVGLKLIVHNGDRQGGVSDVDRIDRC